MSAPRIAVVYYSSTGHIHALAHAAAEGAEKAGGEVRLRKVAELAPDDVVRSVPAWKEHLESTADVPEATLDDLEWADGYLFGTPTRFGNIAAQLRQFLDTTSPLWEKGALANKPASGFTSAETPHGGQEATLLSLYQTFMHWGSVVVPMGYIDPGASEHVGNPYGVSHLADGSRLDEKVLDAARYQGQRVTDMARALAPLAIR
ncbi:NAD(P)H:quinone oxidoreductase [Actinobacteria bacterium YIM 96077]|uniref:NAD(P)H dehydrogenase n=1 Tax=Phytoactinopolyspora halophila TaxID=1981511 RepID=A0A329QGT5_9ACTN|nr:NAD(P)H:quinone oxidoreductase [Phytoactinopolyspora halophila]AYY15668.1 NAD(P)H:quinone oxidoreductase [Actinobacteria bacterium YIM 96077]RAW11500.1 NAD(P)H dehydrogenase [Phytoactinopolyspora halophila]